MVTGPWPCYQCDKNITKPTLWVHVYDGGRHFVMQGQNEDDLNIEEAGDLGWHPVGSDCAKKLRDRGVLVRTDNTRD